MVWDFNWVSRSVLKPLPEDTGVVKVVTWPGCVGIDTACY